MMMRTGTSLTRDVSDDLIATFSTTLCCMETGAILIGTATMDGMIHGMQVLGIIRMLVGMVDGIRHGATTIGHGTTHIGDGADGVRLMFATHMVVLLAHATTPQAVLATHDLWGAIIISVQQRSNVVVATDLEHVVSAREIMQDNGTTIAQQYQVSQAIVSDQIADPRLVATLAVVAVAEVLAEEAVAADLAEEAVAEVLEAADKT